MSFERETNCEDFARGFDGFLDGEMDSQAMRAMALHASRCPTCGGDVERAETLQGALVRSVETELDRLDTSGLWSAIEARLEPPRGALSERLRQYLAENLKEWQAGAALPDGAIVPGTNRQIVSQSAIQTAISQIDDGLNGLTSGTIGNGPLHRGSVNTRYSFREGKLKGLALTGGLALAALFGRAMVGPLFAQTAWTNVTFIGSEVRDPARNLVRALLAGCGVVVALYLLANLAYIAVLPFSGIEHAPQNRVAVAAMNALFGQPGAMCMAAAIMISTFGCNNGLILAGARVYYAMARDGLFCRRVGTTNAHHVPAAALVAQAAWTALLTLPRTMTTSPATGTVVYGNVYSQLLEYIVSADLFFYLLLAAAVIALRKKSPAAERPYHTWGYPIVPIVSILLAGILIVDLAWLAPATSGIGIAIVLTGLPVYLAWRKGQIANR